jgi:hypothetical protein
MIISEVENSHQGFLDYQLSFIHLRDDRVLTMMRLVPKRFQHQPFVRESGVFKDDAK